MIDLDDFEGITLEQFRRDRGIEPSSHKLKDTSQDVETAEAEESE